MVHGVVALTRLLVARIPGLDEFAAQHRPELVDGRHGDRLHACLYHVFILLDLPLQTEPWETRLAPSVTSAVTSLMPSNSRSTAARAGGSGNADGESRQQCAAVTAPENVWQIVRSREGWTHEAPAPIDMARLQSEMESGLTLQQGKQGGQDVVLVR